MTRYFITGGGTGGHIYPAIAVADFLKDSGEIFYVGNPRNLEFDIVKQKGYKFLPVRVQGLPRKVDFDLIKWFFLLVISVIHGIYYILKYKPDVIFGTGGYVSAPVLIAAVVLKIPFVMHDCDAQPGLVTRKLSPYASAVSLAFECAQNYVNNENCFITGNPLREGFKTLSKATARKNLGLENKLTLCIMGGSQGAKSINSASVGILKTLSQKYDMQIILQTGKKKFNMFEEHLAASYPEYNTDKNILVKPYFDDMVSVLKASDIAVSRAGSLSISELCASAIASVFVPYPHAAADHQRKNARFMAEKNAGIYIEDDKITSKILLNTIVELVENPQLLKTLQNNAFKLAKFNSTFDIVKLINESL